MTSYLKNQNDLEGFYFKLRFGLRKRNANCAVGNKNGLGVLSLNGIG